METVQQVISGVYAYLRRPSELKLHPDDVKDLLNDELRGRVQDIDLLGREQRTESRDVTIDADDYDYRVRMSAVPDFEPMKLEYCAAPNSRLWCEVVLVNHRAWKTQNWQDQVIGAFYGSIAVQDGCRLKLNLPPQAVGAYRWRLTYRVPFLRIVQEGERPPLPANFLPLLKVAVTLKAIPLVQDNSPEWAAWTERFIPIFTANLALWENRWQAYLETSVEAPTQPIKPFNHFRRSRRSSTRGYVPWQ